MIMTNNEFLKDLINDVKNHDGNTVKLFDDMDVSEFSLWLLKR